MRHSSVAIAALLLFAACGDGGESADSTVAYEPAEEAVPTTIGGDGGVEPSEPTGGEDGEKLLEPVPAEPSEPVTGEASGDLVESIIGDAVARTGVAEEDIVVIRSESVTWNDGSLGCPVHGESYTMALVNGYWVVLEIDGVEYDYRANDRGFFRLCEGTGAAPSNPSG